MQKKIYGLNEKSGFLGGSSFYMNSAEPKTTLSVRALKSRFQRSYREGCLGLSAVHVKTRSTQKSTFLIQTIYFFLHFLLPQGSKFTFHIWRKFFYWTERCELDHRSKRGGGLIKPVTYRPYRVGEFHENRNRPGSILKSDFRHMVLFTKMFSRKFQSQEKNFVWA